MGVASSATAASVLEQYGRRLESKTLLVTGANGGLAKAFVSALLRTQTGVGAVVLHCRTQASADSLASELREECGSDICPELLPMGGDLGDLAQVDALADRYLSLNRPLDVMLCCAGVATIPKRRLTIDGFEAQFAINHLAHFRLVNRLLPAMLPHRTSDKNGSFVQAAIRADGASTLEMARVVMVSTDPAGLRHASLDFADLQREVSYSMFGAYIGSKAANVLFAKELQRRHGDSLTAISCTPGTVPDTNIARELGPGLRFAFRYLGPGLFGRSPDQGAATLAYCVAAPNPMGGGFYADSKLVPHLGRCCEDEAVATHLWQASEELVTKTRTPLSTK